MPCVLCIDYVVSKKPTFSCNAITDFWHKCPGFISIVESIDKLFRTRRKGSSFKRYMLHVVSQLRLDPIDHSFSTQCCNLGCGRNTIVGTCVICYVLGKRVLWWGLGRRVFMQVYIVSQTLLYYSRKLPIVVSQSESVVIGYWCTQYDGDIFNEIAMLAFCWREWSKPCCAAMIWNGNLVL